MTMLKHVYADDAGYLELAEFPATFGEPDRLREDLEDFCKRIIDCYEK